MRQLRRNERVQLMRLNICKILAIASIVAMALTFAAAMWLALPKG